MDMMPITVTRSVRHVEEADPDMLKLLLIGGTSPGVINQGNKQVVLAPGEFAFYDTRKPYEVSVGLDGSPQVSMMTFMFPPSMLPLPRDGIRNLAVTRMPAVAGIGELTAQFLQQLARNIDDYTPAEAARLSTAAGSASTAITCPVGPTISATRRATFPAPLPMSSTRMPGASPDASSSLLVSGSKTLPCRMSRSYSAARSANG